LKIIKRFIDYNIQIQHARHEKGSGLIIVILVLAFLLAVGTALISVTGINSKVAGNIRTQHQAFNAARRVLIQSGLLSKILLQPTAG